MSEPDEVRASELVGRAWELTDLADYARAAETAAHAIDLAPDNALAHTIRAWALENLGGPHLDDARSGYESAVALDADGRVAPTGLADLLRRTGSEAEAERLYRAVAEDATGTPDERPRSLEFQGWSLYRLGRWDEAIRSFRASLDHAPGRLSVLFDLALALLASGRDDEARAAYASAVETVRAADVRRRRAPLTVASEDLDEAISADPDLATLPGTAAIRGLLQAEVAALGPADPSTSDPPDADL